MKTDQTYIGSGFSHWRHARLKSLWFIDTHVREAVVTKEIQRSFNVLLIHPRVMPKFNRNPVLRKSLLAGKDVVTLFIAWIEPGRKLEKYHPKLTRAVEGKQGSLKSLPEFGRQFRGDIS